MNLVVLAGNCYPVCSATGAIAIKYARFLSEKCRVMIICAEQVGHRYDGTKIDNFEVYSISNWRLKWAQRAKKNRDKTKGAVSKLHNISFQLARVIGRFQATFFTINNNAWYVNKAYKKLEEIEGNFHIDAILSCAAPHEALWAAKKFKRNHPNVRWVSYWGDLLATKINKLNIFVSEKKLETMEKSLCEACDYVLTTDENYKKLFDHLDKKDNITSLPYTLNQDVIDKSHEPVVCKSQKTTIIYMGAFYRNIRNPEYFLHVMTLLQCDYQLFLFTSGNCEDIERKYIKQSNGRIIKRGLVPKAELVEELRKADILVNLENSMANSNPSKLFELVSYGKPIIDFSYSDCVIDSLKKYPLSLNVNMNRDLNINKNIIESFIKQDGNKILDIETILKAYSEHLDCNVKKKLLEAFGALR